MKTLLKQSTILGLLISVLFALNLLAFTEPTAPPPGGIVPPPPLNVGPAGQSKTGGLILNTGGATYGLIVDKGRVGVNTTSPGAALHVLGSGIISGGLDLLSSRLTSLGVPIGTTDAATKGYVDAQVSAAGAGASYTAFGVTTCAPGWTVAYTGTVLTRTFGGSSSGDPICVAGYSATGGISFTYGWAASGNSASNQVFSCAVCVK